ncbi:MAG: ATP-binding protein, partial [Pyrinomonadaceae bacterium]
NDQGIDRKVYFRPVSALGLSVAVVADQAGITGLSWTWLIVGLVLALAGVGLAAWLIARALRREQRGIERVTQGAAEIAAGNLNNRILLESSTTLKPLADSFNTMTEKLREQIAHETEARQFQSFMRLSAGITHDLKNSIQALQLLVKNLETKFDDPEYRVHALRSLEQATNRLTGLVGRLSEPVRSMSGEMPRPQPTDLVSLIRRVMRATAELDQMGHTLNIDLPDKLIVAVDGERIEKVFENLIINAMQAMDDGPGTLTIAATADADNCTVTVGDTGAGMTEEFIRDRLFRPFFTTKAAGIGLGLYTCHEVVRAHGGRIEAESKVGSGTTFRVVLPLRAQALWSAMGGSTAA